MADEELWVDKQAKGFARECIFAVWCTLFMIVFIVSIPVRVYRWVRGRR